MDVLVNNAAFPMTHKSLLDVSDAEWDYTSAVNIGAMFHLCKAPLTKPCSAPASPWW